jgi:methionyl-tRNA formyltransferase
MTPRVVFMGTPEASVPTLDALTETCDVVLVVTRPDRPKGRSRRPQPPPVKERAIELGLSVAQPENGAELERSVRDHEPLDLGVVVAYGRILSPKILEIPAHGLLNVHYSLLPRWRGAAPVARALMAGDNMTGVTIMRMDEELDTGPVLTAQAVDISSEENAGELTGRLSTLGARLVVESIEPYLNGRLEPVAQSDEGAVYAPKIEADDRPLDIGAAPESTVDRVRGLAPSPAATLDIDGDRHKIFAARPHPARPDPGTWLAMEGVPVAGFLGGGVELVRLQPPGRNPQSGGDWLRGRHTDHGQVA